MEPGREPRPPIEPPVISIENVTKRFGAFTAVESASLEIGRGELFSLLGPSGCGKTTLLRMIAGFEEVTSGRIRLEGADVSEVPPFRRNVNTVFQHYALFPHLDVFGNVAFGPRAKGLPRAEVERRVRDMLGIVRLDDLADRRPDQLSGGQKQRVALARALVNLPGALLLDEPLSALDPKLRQAMQIELRRIQREVGITFLFVTHDQEEALTMSDRIAVMNAGRIEQVGSPEEIYTSPETVFVAGFVGRANLLAATVERIDGPRVIVRLARDGHAEAPHGTAPLAPGDPGVLLVRPEHLRLTARPPEDLRNAIAVTLVERVFQGPWLRCVVRDREGDELTALLRSGSLPPGLDPGGNAWVSWNPADSRLLRPVPER